MSLSAVFAESTSSSIASLWMWVATVAVLLALLAADFLVTRKPHTVSTREAVWWSVFYLALPFVFTLWLWPAFGANVSLEFMTGFVVEKSLSVDNLFVFMLILTGFAVPEQLRQRVLLFGVIGAIALRAVFIALGAAMLHAGTWAFLVFGVILLASTVKILHGAITGADQDRDVRQLRSVRLLRRVIPVTEDYQGTRMQLRDNGRRALTPLAVVVFAVFATDIVFAVDSVPAVYGITEDPYLVFTTNAFALLGLRALYFVLQSLLAKLRHLNYGLAIILAFIGVKLVLHWAHGIWKPVPDIPTPVSLAVIVVVLATVTVTSFVARRREERAVVGSK